MGRKKRRGRSSYVVTRTSKKNVPGSGTPKHRFAQHLERDGQKQQLSGNLRECAIPSGVPATHTSYRGGCNYKLIRAYEVSDPRGYGLSGGGNIKQRLYHGTRETSAAHIMLQSFKLPAHGGMFGKAIYLTPNIGKAFGFTDSKNPIILVCDANLGRVRTFNESDRGLDLFSANNAGFDTAFGERGVTASWGGSLTFSEYAVYDPNRIRIRYLLEYKAANQK